MHAAACLETTTSMFPCALLKDAVEFAMHVWQCVCVCVCVCVPQHHFVPPSTARGILCRARAAADNSPSPWMSEFGLPVLPQHTYTC
jgi:hypothetical protein